MRRFILVFLLFMVSCSLLEALRLLGGGTKLFKEQGKVYSKTFNKDFFSSYQQILKVLEKMGAFVYRGSRKEHFIVAINFHKSFERSIDTTQVAIFFKELESGKTQVEVASLNYSLAKFVAPNYLKSLRRVRIEILIPNRIDKIFPIFWF